MPNLLHRVDDLRMRADVAALVLVDYQQRLMPAIDDAEEVLRRAGFLAEVAHILGVPVIGTAQNPDKLGPNLPPVGDQLDRVVAKMTFGACEGGLDEVLVALDTDSDRPRDVVIAGCETHVCLLQTALGLLEAGRRVWVVADASGSRKAGDKEAALARLASAGATVVTAEMVAFEWLRTSDHAQFRAISRLVKEL
ncbi:isochorismatase family protein [Granulicoccus sp. GXG6511]|uniref:isochorismatase family protein n=1 Tax=Granulicoccus sp. GXG6511 TaxID=3381351 RepID=UPI003D7CD305